MGDSRRHEVFAQFLARNFPPKKYQSVLAVADGKGELALHLARSYRVRVIEANPRQEFYRKRVRYTSAWFDTCTPVEEDFIVGMHPDEATSLIIRNAERNGKGWAIVPCCVKGVDAIGVRNADWIRKLKSISTRRIQETFLPIAGKNLVLWAY
jgi:hypothetical protein